MKTILVSLLVVCLGATAHAGDGKTKSLKTVGKYKLCDAGPGLAGWLEGGREIWSLARAIDRHKKSGVLISFYATWCVPCRQGLPMLQALAPQLKKRNVDLILVAVPPFDGDVTEFLSGIGVTLPTIRDKFGSILQQWLHKTRGAGAKTLLPRTVLVNDLQQIVAIFGEEGPDFAEVVLQNVDTMPLMCKPGGAVPVSVTHPEDASPDDAKTDDAKTDDAKTDDAKTDDARTGD